MSVRREGNNRLRYLIPVLALAIALGLIVSASGAWAGAPPKPGGTGAAQKVKKSLKPLKMGTAGDKVVSKSARPSAVLYDQYDNAAANATSAQNFEPENDPFDNELADDFVVPAATTWNIANVEIDGQYFNGVGPANSVNIVFYANAGGLPGAAVCSRPNMPYLPGPASGDFSINITPACSLGTGTYWMGVQVNMDFSAGGQWGWTDRSVTSNSPAAWQNPGGGFATACTTWGARGATCGIDPANPDQVFRLNDSPAATPTPTNTPSCTPEAYSFATATATIVPGTTDAGSNCDDCAVTIPLPFTFNFYNRPFTSVNAISNGNLQFTSSNTTFANACLPDAGMTELIAPHWGDLMTSIDMANCSAFPSGCGIFTSVSGSAPNRIFNIEWRAVYFFDGPAINFEARLYETTGQIQFVYGTLNGTGSAATIGVQKDTGSSATQFSCNTSSLSDGMSILWTYSTGTCATSTPTNTFTPTLTPTLTPTPAPCGPGSNYFVSTSTGVAIVPGTTDIGNHCDDCTTNIPLPFTFNYYGQPFTSANASSNGNLQFTSANSAFSNSCLPAASMTDIIAGHWDDLYTADTAGGQGIFTSLSGSAPNRIFNIEWRAQFCCASGAPVVNFEMRLHEGPNGVIDLVYGAVEGDGAGATIGVQRGTGIQFTQFSCDTASISSGLQVHFEPLTCGANTFTPTRTNTPTHTATHTATPFCTPEGYAFTTSTGAAIVPGVTNTGNACDDCATNIALPFPFLFYNTPFNSVNAISNGNLQFVSTNAAFTNACLPDPTMDGLAAPHWDDLRTDTGAGCAGFPGGSCGIFTTVTGSAPNRVFIIEWRAVYFATPASSVNFEVKLYETTGRIEYVYGTLNGTGSGATVGTQKDTGSSFTQFSCNTASLSTGLMIQWNYNTGNCPTNTPTATRTPTNTATATNTPLCPGAWTTQAVYPIPVLDEAVASHGGKVYSFGGVSNGTLPTNAYVYDPVPNTWTAIAPLPGGREQASAVSDGTYIYIVGGADSVGANTNTIWRYNPADNTYNTTLATFTTATWAQAAAYLNGKIYKIAGCGSNCTSFLANVEVYDIANNTWSAAAPLPAAAGWLMATGLGNFVYVAGGTAAAETAKTYRYDPATNIWDDAAIADLPATRWGSSEGVAKGQWRLAGGYSGGVIVNSALSWNPNTNTWNAIDPMPAARARMSGDVVGVDFYSFGGRDPIIGGFNGTTNNQKYTDLCQSPTATPTPGNILVGHLTVQSVAQPNVRNTLVTPTLTLCVGGVPQSQVLTLDQSAFFTITTGLPNGSYNYSIKWVRGLANAGSLSLSGGTSTHEFGTLRGGDSNNSNIVNSIDFNQLRTAFGTANNLATDFNLDNITNSLDFNILRGNFGVAGGILACP